jgi:hypothetical protein
VQHWEGARYWEMQWEQSALRIVAVARVLGRLVGEVEEGQSGAEVDVAEGEAAPSVDEDGLVVGHSSHIVV